MGNVIIKQLADWFEWHGGVVQIVFACGENIEYCEIQLRIFFTPKYFWGMRFQEWADAKFAGSQLQAQLHSSISAKM